MRVKQLVVLGLFCLVGGFIGCGEVAEDPKYDIVLKRDNSPDKLYPQSVNDLARCEVLRAVLREAQPKDTILLSNARFDCDGKNKGTVLFPNDISVIGKGMTATKLYSNVYSDDQGSAFEIRSGVFSDLSFENQSWQVNEDGRTIEFYPGLKRTEDNIHYAHDSAGNKIVEQPNPGPFGATLDRVDLAGNAWVVYDWSGRGHHWTIRDSQVRSGRQGVSMMAGGGDFQQADIWRTLFDIDTRRSADIGWTSDRLVGGGYGLVVRGGHTTCTDCTFNMRCGETGHPASYAPRCVGVFDGNNFGSASSPWTYITLVNPTFHINGNGSKDVFDLFFTEPNAKVNLQVTGGAGDGPNGAITRNW